MKATRVRDLTVVALVVAVLSWILVRQIYGSLPALSWFAPLSLLGLGVVELVAARALHARINRAPGAGRVDPLQAARALALAKASSIAGAVFTGLWIGLLAHTVPNLGFLAAAQGDTIVGVLGVAGGALLTAAGLVLERACRTPEDPLDRRDGAGSPGPGDPA